MTWQEFVRKHGHGVRVQVLATVIGRPVQDIDRFRQRAVCVRHGKGQRKEFAALFALFHGRTPHDDEWPAPQVVGQHGTYEWQAPELALLASLVGRIGVREICTVLTARLRKRTLDPSAERNRNAVQAQISKIGLQTTDVVGGITVTQAANELGSLGIVQHAIADRRLQAHRVGRLWVIPYAAWDAFKASRIEPPHGSVPLRSIREGLAIVSDKLSEFARMGFVPTATLCNPSGTMGRTSRYGTWYIDQVVADQLLADRRAGRPMPWHGKPLRDNLKQTFARWQERRHPPACATCRQIWGAARIPASFAEFEQRYPPLAHGAKRHLTMRWNPGLTLQQLANETNRSLAHVRRAIANGNLAIRREGRITYITRTDAARWIARKCPSGDGEKSWISTDTAMRAYGFSGTQLAEFIAQKKLRAKIGTNGPMRGVVYVARQQCADLRAGIGYTEREAAKRVGVSIPRLRELLAGVNWRGAARIPLVTVQAVIKRVQSREGFTIAEAANELDQTQQWVLDRITDGTVRVLRPKWDRERVYLSAPMVKRLRRAVLHPKQAPIATEDWLFLNESARLVGVSTTTVLNWVGEGVIPRQKAAQGFQYHVPALLTKARQYWARSRSRRDRRPEWLKQSTTTNHGCREPA